MVFGPLAPVDQLVNDFSRSFAVRRILKRLQKLPLAKGSHLTVFGELAELGLKLYVGKRHHVPMDMGEVLPNFVQKDHVWLALL